MCRTIKILCYLSEKYLKKNCSLVIQILVNDFMKIGTEIWALWYKLKWVANKEVVKFKTVKWNDGI